MILLLGSLALANPRLDALAGEARDLVATDPLAAHHLASKVLRREPRNPLARFVRAEVSTFVAADLQDPVAREIVLGDSVADYEHVARTAPDQPWGRDARAALDRLGVRSGLVWTPPSCPPEAVSAHDDARTAYLAGDAATARHWFRVSLEGCPEHAGWWIDAGLAWMPAEPEMALIHYETALDDAPCQWEAQFLRGVALQATDRSATAGAALLDAVACNPGYTPAWTAAAELASRAGRAPRLVVPPLLPTDADAARDAGPVWSAWLEAHDASAAKAPVERTLSAARAALAAVPEPADPTWRILAEAARDGSLEQGALILLFEPELAAEVATPERHAALVAWLQGHVLPVP